MGGTEVGNLRGEVREWCASNVPDDWRVTQRGASHEENVAFLRWWSSQLRDSGWFAPHWPKEFGGGFSVVEQVVIAEEMARGDAPRNALFQVALYNAAPAILQFGTDEQRERYLRGMLAGEVWCQGFSEPDAGSDLAGLKTRATRQGGSYVITGQKVWTSLAMEADWCILLARTDPEAPKHKGLSYFVVDMHSPGIEVRPIRQATGASEFCETFLNEVEVPQDHVIGQENDGWRVAQGTLSSERAVVILEMAERLRRNGIGGLINESRVWEIDGQRPMAFDDAARERLGQLFAESQVLRHLVNEQVEGIIRGEQIGAEASVIKVFYSELLQTTMREAVNFQELPGQLDQPLLMAAGWETGNWMSDYLNSWGWTIAGGSNEIMRNIIGERMLGLPREMQG